MEADERADEDAIVELIGDEYVRTILSQTAAEPRSVDALSDACDADPSTIYRRIEQLEEADLVTDQQQLDPDGHHYKVYAAQLRELRVRLDDEGMIVEIDRREEETPADRFTRLYEGFK